MKNKTLQKSLFALGAASVGLAFTGNAAASGFALMEQSVSGLGQAFAGAGAAGEDATTIWFNPAGMTKLPGRQLAAGGHYISVGAQFTNNGSANNALVGGGAINGGNDDGGVNAVIPNIYYSKQLNNEAWFGLAVNSPFGLSTKYDPTWVGRYHAIESSLMTINVQPTFAYKFTDRLSGGIGLNIIYADATITNAIDQSSVCLGIEAASPLVPAGTCAGAGLNVPNGADGFIKLEGSDIGYGLNIGAQFEPSKSTRIGLSARSEIDLNVKGDADFDGINATLPAISGNAFTDTGAQSSVVLPASLSLSVSHDVSRDLTLLADWTYTGWSAFDEFRFTFDNAAQSDGVTTEDWRDSNRYSIGLNYRSSDSLTYRMGVAYDETPVPSPERRTARIPDSDRTWLSFGVSYTYSKELTFDIGYTHLFVDDVRINNTLESAVTTANSTLTGTYEGDVDLLSAQVRWNF